MDKKERVILSSIHQVKGLEFDVIFFLFLDENVIPSKRSTDINEERRIFYVGITRARRYLFLINNRGKESIFLKEIDRKNIKI